MRGTVVAIGVFAALVGGCGSSSHRTALVARSPQVVSGTCSSTAGTSGPVKQSCVMVLSDGRRFSCPPAVARSRPSVAELEHTRVCARLSSLVLSPGTRAVIDAIRRTQACLARQGIRALGGPVLPPNRSSSNSADGVLALSHAGSPAFIAFYTDPARATRLEAGVARNARHLGDQVERRGAITIVWSHPSVSERRQVEACAAS